MNPWFNDEQEVFRSEVQSLIRDHAEVNGFFVEADATAWNRVRELYRALADRNWLALAWPESLGGTGRSPAFEAILWDELAYARAARPPFSAGIVAKAIIAAGTTEQHEYFLPPIRKGELHFALGYSEPEAGSDLTGLRTKAVRVGDSYVVTGEKRWTSLAHFADMLWLLCRTGTQESRGRGLSILIVDLRSPGITISPIPLMDGGRLNEIHLDEVVVPAFNRIGEENEGWAIIARSLAVERHVQFSPKRLVRDLEDLRSWVQTAGKENDPDVRARLRDLDTEVAKACALSLLVVDAVEHQRDAIVEAAANKLVSTVLCQQIARAAVDIGAPDAIALSSQMEFLWRQSILETLGGGTSEIMRGIIARNKYHLQASH